MPLGLIGKKLGHTRVYDANGVLTPVTVVLVGPNRVLQVKKKTDRDGYDAVQLGLVEFIKAARINKPLTGHLKKANADGMKFLKELRLRPGDDDLKPGDKILVDQFKAREIVDVTGVSKGRGFASVIKRHHFRGGPGGHGSMFGRAPGSIGASSFPSRVMKGMRMAGHMGMEDVTVRNLEIVDIDTEENVLMVKGAIPGPNGGYVVVRRTKKRGV